MIGLLQRVNWAQVRIEGKLHAEIGRGLLVFVGLEQGDDTARADKLLDKLLALRVFGDQDGKMNLDLKLAGGELLLVSQFTLAATTDKGLRPGFSTAMPPAPARELYEYLLATARNRHEVVASGKFGADMKIALENDGPVTFILRT
jgi:D-tyrosyl-tRNA(Tyr) deacylase